MQCSELAAKLTDFIDGALDPAEEDAAVEHLATCGECESVLAGTRSVVALASRHAKVDLSSDERARVLSRVLAAGGQG